MRRPVAVSAFVMLTACGGDQQSCDFGPYLPDTPPATDQRVVAVSTTSSGPGRITFVSSSPVPGVAISGCGPASGGCAERLKVVFSVKPDVDLRSQPLRVSLFTEAQARLQCSSTVFDLSAGETFSIEVSCPASGSDVATPLRTATMIAETGTGPSRIEQDWNVPFVFLP